MHFGDVKRRQEHFVLEILGVVHAHARLDIAVKRFLRNEGRAGGSEVAQLRYRGDFSRVPAARAEANVIEKIPGNGKNLVHGKKPVKPGVVPVHSAWPISQHCTVACRVN